MKLLPVKMQVIEESVQKVVKKAPKASHTIKLNIIKARKLPNSVSHINEEFSGIGGYTEFYLSDINKMKTMTAEEQKEFKKQLMLKGQCYTVYDIVPQNVDL